VAELGEQEHRAVVELHPDKIARSDYCLYL